MAAIPEPIVEFKKPAAIKGNMRKRKTESESIPAREDQSEHIIHKDKKQKEDTEIEDPVMDRAPTVGVVYEATRSVTTQARDVATPSLEIDTAIENDAISRAEKAKEFLNTKVKDDKVYRGLANYNKFFVEKDSLGPKGAGLVAGPLRSNQYARVTTFIDYKPDLCKDYNETGYCGFGDTCKFLHDRGDYKRGWELDKEWEEKMKAAKEGNRENADPRLGGAVGNEEGKYFIADDAEGEEFPFACHLCRKDFTAAANPVETRCHHFFCEKCILKRYSSAPNRARVSRGRTKCPVCQTQMHGIFNTNKKLLERIKKKASQTGDD